MALLAAVAASGCETFTDLDPSEYAPVLVVQARFEPGVPWTVAVGRTVALGDPAVHSGAVPPVEGAHVTVTDDLGRMVVLPPVSPADGGQGLYGAGDGAVGSERVVRGAPAPELGRTYTVRVEAEGYPSVSATSASPTPPSDLALVFLGGWEAPDASSTGDRAYGDVDLGVRFAPSDQAAAYRVAYMSARAALGAGACDPRGLARGTFLTAAPLIREATFFDDLSSGSEVGRLFDAILDVGALLADGVVAFELVGEQPGPCLVAVEVEAMSAEAAAARRSEERRRSAEGNPFAEPVPAYSNVVGGAGVVAGVARSRALVQR